MNEDVETDIRYKLKTSGFKSDLGPDIRDLGIELTICQLLVVILSLVSVVFLFVPLLYLRSPIFLAGFIGVSFVCLGISIWFWINKAKICEHPEEFQ